MVFEDRGIDISVAVFSKPAVTAFGVRPAESKLLYTPKIDNSSGCYCSEITFCPHTHGTHIESLAHVLSGVKSTRSRLTFLKPILLARLFHVAVEDGAIRRTEFDGDNVVEAVVLRTGSLDDLVNYPDGLLNLTEDPSVFVTETSMRAIKSSFPKVRVLLIDSVSVDPSQDGGRLGAHREFFGSDDEDRFIVELCRIPRTLDPGIYALSLNVSSMESDAIPCRPVLYPLSCG